MALFRSQHTKPTLESENAAPATPADSYRILENQRLHRPVSPHLTIYRPQTTWVLSIGHRITGAVLSGGLYIFGFSYLVAPLFGLKITSAAMAAGFAKWPVIAKFAAKAAVGAPFAFHSYNGIRHLVWDVGAGMRNLQVVRSGWGVVGLTALTALGLAFI